VASRMGGRPRQFSIILELLVDIHVEGVALVLVLLQRRSDVAIAVRFNALPMLDHKRCAGCSTQPAAYVSAIVTAFPCRFHHCMYL
jgi:hypothetical protein